jgi:hypothetical protein
MAKRTQKLDDPFVEAKAGSKAFREDIVLTQAVVELLNKDLANTRANATALKTALGDKSGGNLAQMQAVNTAMAQAIELHKQEQAVIKAKTATENQLIKLYEKAEADRAKRDAKIISDNAKKEAQYNKEIQKVEQITKKIEQQGTAYNRVNGWLNKLSQEHRNLAIKQELGIKLTSEEIKRMETLTGRIQRYDTALKNVDATQGKHQRNVGNYKSAFNGLGVSINQITRELPAVGVSFQTFILGISNNVPMLQDEIQKIIAVNKELASSGQPTVSVAKQIATSFFSLTSMISLGTTALVLFSGAIADWFKGSEKSEKQLRLEAKQQEELNKRRREGSEFVGRESASLVGHLIALKNTNAGSKERLSLMNKINEQYGTTLQNLSNEKLFQDQLNNSINRYISYQREAFKVKKNTELIERNLATQDQLYKNIKTNLGLTYSELDKISKKSGSFQLLANELIQGIQPVQTISRELGITEKRANQLVTAYNKLAKADKEAFGSNRSKEEKQAQNDYLFGLVGWVKEATYGVDDLALAEENRSKQLLSSLGALDSANYRLNQYGVNIGDAESKMEDLDITTMKSTKSTKEFTLALNEFDNELERRINLGENERKILQEIEMLKRNAQIDVVSDLVNQELQNQITYAETTGQIFVDTLEKLIAEEFELRKQATIDQAEFDKTELTKKFESERALSIQELEKERDELLKQEGLTANGKKAINTSYQQRIDELNEAYLEKERIVALEREKIELELQQKLGDLDKEKTDRLNQVNNDLIQKQQEFADKSNKQAQDNRKKELAEEKKYYDEILKIGKKSADELLEYQIKKSQERQKILDGNISASEKESDILAQKASQGNLLAEESLKKQQEITNKYRDQRRQEEEKEQALQQAKKYVEIALNITNSLIQKGGEPITSAGKSIGLVSVIKGLFGKGFFFGTDDTGSNSPVADGYGKITGFTHENEQVWSKKDRSDVGFASRAELKKSWDFMNSANMLLPKISTQTDVTHAPILREQLKKLDQMNNKLDKIPNEFFSTEVIQGVLTAVHVKQEGNTTTKRYIGS